MTTFNLEVEVNDRGNSVISITVQDGIVSASYANLLFSDYGSSREIEMEGIRSMISSSAFDALCLAISTDNEEFEFEDDSCSIW